MFDTITLARKKTTKLYLDEGENRKDRGLYPEKD